jgi:hypothetical protein
LGKVLKKPNVWIYYIDRAKKRIIDKPAPGGFPEERHENENSLNQKPLGLPYMLRGKGR